MFISAQGNILPFYYFFYIIFLLFIKFLIHLVKFFQLQSLIDDNEFCRVKNVVPDQDLNPEPADERQRCKILPQSGNTNGNKQIMTIFILLNNVHLDILIVNLLHTMSYVNYLGCKIVSSSF